jgi:hypothetical protein
MLSLSWPADCRSAQVHAPFSHTHQVPARSGTRTMRERRYWLIKFTSLQHLQFRLPGRYSFDAQSGVPIELARSRSPPRRRPGDGLEKLIRIAALLIKSPARGDSNESIGRLTWLRTLPPTTDGQRASGTCCSRPGGLMSTAVARCEAGNSGPQLQRSETDSRHRGISAVCDTGEEGRQQVLVDKVRHYRQHAQ